jgi:hypothetical protein
MLLARESSVSLDSTTEDEALPLAKHSPAADVAWVLLFLDGLVLLCSALFWITRGRFFDPGFYEALTGGTWSVASALMPSLDRVATASVRFAGLLGVVTSALVIAIATTSFRRGERWAWYAMLLLPAFAVLDFSLSAGYEAVTPTSVAWNVTIAGLAIVSLGISYRAFFAPVTPVCEEQPAPA